MEKEDHLIKELIEEGFLKSAPEDFTENVMTAVAKTEMRDRSVFGDNIFSYATIVMIPFVLAGIIIYFVDSSFYGDNFGFFTEFAKKTILSFSGLFSGSLTLNAFSDNTFMFVGIMVIIIILLVFDRLFFSAKKLTSLFV